MDSKKIKIATLNLCLGLKNKKDEVKRLIKENEIDILCLQETEIISNYPVQLLSFGGFNYESESNNVKSRCGIYISNEINYVRRSDIEIANMHIIVIDLKDSTKTRIINVYRTFSPQPPQTQREFFVGQVALLSSIITANTILIGDFNLDHRKRFDINYSHKNYFNLLNPLLLEKNLTQIVKFDTWSRYVNSVKVCSILDHIYVKDPTVISSLSYITPTFGDHVLLSFVIHSSRTKPHTTFKRNWKHYNKDKLISKLNECDWNIENDDVQNFWHVFESKLVEIIDTLCPLEDTSSKNFLEPKPPPLIKNKLNRRNNLLKKMKTHPSDSVRVSIKLLNKEIKQYFYTAKAKLIRRGILPGNSKTLWDAVKKAKDQNLNSIPEEMFHNNNLIAPNLLTEHFGNFFTTKVNSIITNLHSNPRVYNGQKKVNEQNSFFMSSADVLSCMSSIKIKNCEGFDRIPQRILVDGANILINPLSKLFQKIYFQKEIPEQWLIAKVTPIHKKGPKNQIENYRPIANLCSTSKIFEKLILKRIQAIEIFHKVDLTGKQQHGFKKCKSTSTLALQLQSLIARALDDDNYVLMASVDLSAAFDVVNIDLLMKRLRILGLPDDVLSLVELWLRKRLFYIDINGEISKLHEIDYGTIQGSILGPVLYAIYVSPLFDLTELSNFADDNFALTWHKNKQSTISSMELKINVIVNWLKDSGLKVNETKTELCLFYRRDTPPIEITIGNDILKSKTEMNVLGVIFDSKLTWSSHVSKQINKANQALHAIRLIKKYFKPNEILTLLTSNFYSILYYNSEVWHIPNLKPEIKQHLLSASANALKLAQLQPDRMESFLNIHSNAERATPEKILLYKHAILLHKLYNLQTPPMEWVDIHFKQTFNSRQSKFNIIKSNNFKVGNNILSNRLSVLNNKIILSDLNLSLDSFKCKYKLSLLAP
jgi:exonuclease III